MVNYNGCKLKVMIEVFKITTGDIRFERVWAMPNSRTFQIKPIKELREQEFKKPFEILDPFPFNAKMDCFDYLSQFDDESCDECDLDPPYTKRQVSEHYKKNGGKCTGWHTSSGWTKKVKDEVNRIIKPGGKVITYGYNTVGMGIKRGYTLTRILDVCHGGDHYDTLCTVEIKNI